MSRLLHKTISWLPIEKRIERKILTSTYKSRNDLAPSNLAELFNDFVPSGMPKSSDSPALAVPFCKFKTVGDRFFSSAGPRARNSFPPSFRAGAVVYSHTTPGTVSALLRRSLLATNFVDVWPLYFVGVSSDSSSAPTSSAAAKLYDSLPIARRALRALYKKFLV